MNHGRLKNIKALDSDAWIIHFEVTDSSLGLDLCIEPLTGNSTFDTSFITHD